MKLAFTFLFSLLVVSQSLWAQQEASDEKASLFLYGVTLSTEYDDQIVPANGSSASGDVIYSVQPQIGFDIKRSRWRSRLDYLPAITYSSQRRSTYDLISHSLGFYLQRRVSKRLTFDLQNNFLVTNNPFDNVRANSELQPFNPLDQPNSTLSGNVVSRRMEQVGSTLTYAVGKRSNVGVSGNYLYSDYLESVQSGFNGSRRTVSSSGDAFYSHQLGPRSTMGLRYRYENLDFGHGSVKTQSQSVLYSWDMQFNPTLALSLFAGPNYSDTRNQPPDILSPPLRAQQWSGVGGAILAWRGQHHDFSAGATRQVSDGGGSRGNVLLDSYSLKIGRQISRRFNVSTFANYNHNKLLLPLPGSDSSFDYLDAGVEFNREITDHTFLGLFYMRIQENGNSTLNRFPSGNRVGVSLSYRNQRPMGR